MVGNIYKRPPIESRPYCSTCALELRRRSRIDCHSSGRRTWSFILRLLLLFCAPTEPILLTNVLCEEGIPKDERAVSPDIGANGVC